MSENQQNEPGISNPLSNKLRAVIFAHPRAVLMVLSLLLLVISQTAITFSFIDFRWISSTLSLLGLLLFLLSFQSKPLPEKLNKSLKWPSHFFSISPTQSIYLLFSILFAIVASTSNGFGPHQDSMWITISLWLLSLFCVILGGWQINGIVKIRRRTLLSAAGLGFIAFLVRFISISTIPTALTGDEASMGLSAQAFVNGTANNIFSVGWFSFPSFFYFFESIFIRIFGNTTLALRLPSVIAGALTVSAVFLLGRSMFGRLTGWLSALFLIGFHFHIHFSRLGLNNIWDGLSIVLVLGALWYGWRFNRRAYFLAAGLFLGLSQYFYVSSKIVVVLIPIWALFAIVLDKEKLKKNIKNLLLMFIVAFVVIGPLAFFYSQNPSEFLAPMARVRLTPEWIERTSTERDMAEWRVVATQIWTGLKAFTHEPLRAWYVPGTPLLRPTAAALFLLGLVVLALRLRDLQTWLILLVLMGFGMVSGLSFDPPAAQRYVAVAPWLALVGGYALAATTNRLIGFWPGLSRSLIAIAIVLMAWIAVDDARFYFNDYTAKTRSLTDNNAVAQKLANYLMVHTDIKEVYFLGLPRMGYYSIQSTNFLVPDVAGIDINEDWGSSNNPAITTEDPLFVLLPHKEEDLSAIISDYPGGKLIEAQTESGDLIFWIYDTSRAQ